MYEQIISIFSSSEILATVSNNIDDLATIIDGYLSGANNLRIASIILMLLAFILFLFLVIIIYVKSIVSFLKSDNKNTEKDDGAVFLEKTRKMFSFGHLIHCCAFYT